MTLKEEEGADAPLQQEIYLSCGVNPAGEIANIWLLLTTAPRIISSVCVCVRERKIKDRPTWDSPVATLTTSCIVHQLR